MLGRLIIRATAAREIEGAQKTRLLVRSLLNFDFGQGRCLLRRSRGDR